MAHKSPTLIGSLCALLLAGCAATPGSTAAGPAPDPALLAETEAGYALPVTVPDLTSYILVRTEAGAAAPRIASVAETADVLAEFDVVFLGEMHRHAGIHHAQMALFREIHARAPDLALSMEQFERDGQPVLDEYLAGKIGENTLAGRVDLWANYGTSYRPLVEFAKEHRLPVIAANAPGMVVRCVGMEGVAFLARLKPEQRDWAAAEINLFEGPYRDKFLGFATSDSGHGGMAPAKPGEKPAPSAQALRSFEAQATRDDTMAESIARHLQQNPGRKVVHTTGHFHSDAFLGTVERLQLRLPALKIAVVAPVEAKGPAQLSTTDLARGTILLVIRPLPAAYASEEEMRAAIRSQMAQRRENKCEL
jgi:uncharacterized iron-regulated protein